MSTLSTAASIDNNCFGRFKRTGATVRFRQSGAHRHAAPSALHAANNEVDAIKAVISRRDVASVGHLVDVVKRERDVDELSALNNKRTLRRSISSLRGTGDAQAMRVMLDGNFEADPIEGV